MIIVFKIMWGVLLFAAAVSTCEWPSLDGQPASLGLRRRLAESVFGAEALAAGAGSAGAATAATGSRCSNGPRLLVLLMLLLVRKGMIAHFGLLDPLVVANVLVSSLLAFHNATPCCCSRGCCW